MNSVSWKMSAPHIILDCLPSLWQKLTDLVKVWPSYNDNNFACFLRHGVVVCRRRGDWKCGSGKCGTGKNARVENASNQPVARNADRASQQTVSVCAVAQHCCKGDERFQWEMPFLRVFQLRKPWTDFQKILHSWLRPWLTPQAKIWISRPKEGVSAHAWNCHRQASIF